MKLVSYTNFITFRSCKGALWGM